MENYIARNILDVRGRITAAAKRAGRDASEITLIAVSKTKPVETIEAAYSEGERVFGENRVQELLEKYRVLPQDISWHMIGHLQTNKVRQVIDKAVLIHSKFGLPACEVEKFAAQMAVFDRIRVLGLMTVAPFTEKPEENRKYFRQMKRLAVDISRKNIDNVSMEVLSMGMTGDYEIAVEEGATMVRVGTGIFGERDYH